MSHLKCSPGRFDNAKKSGSCFSEEHLETLVTAYNQQNQDKISILTNSSKSKKKLIHELLSNKMKTKCGNDEHCWIMQLNIDYNTKHRLLDVFRPARPTSWYSNIRTWLNSGDIQEVMQQYDKRYPDFIFLGVFPIDFESTTSSGHCVGNEMCTFNINDLISKGKYRFGFIVNTDPHYKSGQHWFAIYCNLNKKKNNYGIYHYDSTANKSYVVQPELSKFMKLVKTQVNDKSFEIKHNTTQSQFKDTECGVFSLVFITQCLKNIPFKEICQKMYNDDMMVKFRDTFFLSERGKMKPQLEKNRE